MREYIEKETAIRWLQKRVTYNGKPIPLDYFEYVLKDIPIVDACALTPKVTSVRFDEYGVVIHFDNGVAQRINVGVVREWKLP